jgi:hypothetical protein
MNRLLTSLSLVLLFSCVHPEATLIADLDPNFNASELKDSKIHIALKDDTIEEKKFQNFLKIDLEKRGFKITASDEAEYQLMYALNMETYKTKEFILLNNPQFISGTLDGKNFTAQQNAYRYEPVTKARIRKEIFLDLYQRRKEKLEKIWSSTLKMENEDYREYTQDVVSELVDAIGKDMNKKFKLQN